MGRWVRGNPKRGLTLSESNLTLPIVERFGVIRSRTTLRTEGQTPFLFDIHRVFRTARNLERYNPKACRIIAALPSAHGFTRR